MISYVLAETGAPSLTYVGHSQGTTQMFSALSENSDWFRERINLFIMLAPVARCDRLANPTLKSFSENNVVLKMLKKMGPELMPSPQVGGKFMSGLLALTRAANAGVSMVSDENITRMSAEGFKNYLGHFPAGSSY